MSEARSHDRAHGTRRMRCLALVLGMANSLPAIVHGETRTICPTSLYVRALNGGWTVGMVHHGDTVEVVRYSPSHKWAVVRRACGWGDGSHEAAVRTRSDKTGKPYLSPCP